MLQPFGDDIWIADGVGTEVAGFRYPTRMVVIRLSRAALFICSPVALSDENRAGVDALGRVGYLVAPNALHHLHLLEWSRAYPGARVYAPPGLRKKRKDIQFDADLDDEPARDWAGEIDQALVRGNLITTEVAFFHRKSGALILTDLIQHFSPGWFTGWRAVIARVDLMTSRAPEVPRKFRYAFIDRRAARAALRRILAWPVTKVLMAHAPPVETDGAAFVARAFRWLLD